MKEVLRLVKNGLSLLLNLVVTPKNEVLMKRVLIFFSVLSFGLSCLGQHVPTDIRKYSTRQGLSNSVVSSIAQDNYGFIWIATQDGLNRFDGYNFKVFRRNNNDTSGISDNFISKIYFENQTQLLWAATNYGLSVYNATTEKFEQLYRTSEGDSALANNVVSYIAPSGNGGLWVGTYGSGVDYLNTQTRKFTHLSHWVDCPIELSEAKILSLIEDSYGFLWMGTQGGGLFRYDMQHPAIQAYGEHDKNTIPSGCINVIYEDREHNIWIGTNEGLTRYNHSTQKFVTFRNDPGNPHSLGASIVKTLYQDYEGVLWIGLQSGGISKLRVTERIFDNPQLATFEHIYEGEDGLSYNSVTAIFEDRERNIWVGTYSGGVNMIGNTPNLFHNIQYKRGDKYSLSYRKVWGMCDDAAGNLWIGTDGGGINVYSRELKKIRTYTHQGGSNGSLSDNAILCGFRDHDNNLWFGSYSGGLNRYDSVNDRFVTYRHVPEDSNSLASDDVRVVYEDRDHGLWVGTNGSGVSLYQPATNNFRNYNSKNSLLGGGSVRCILNDSEGNYWFGTYGEGLYKINSNWTQAERYVYEPGNTNSLATKTVYAILEDAKGRIWIGTEGAGLGLYQRETGTFRYFTVSNGLSSHIIRGITRDGNGYLWITTNNGLSRFDPEQGSFISFNENDGLAASEFTDGSVMRSGGKVFFGNINGLSFIDSHTKITTTEPRVYIYELRLFNKRVGVQSAKNRTFSLEKSMLETREITLAHNQSTLTLEFMAFHLRLPEKTQYAYRLEGFESNWNFSGNQHKATYRNLPAGHYTFKVKASNVSGIWGDAYTPLNITIKPPFWKTWWAYMFYTLSVVYIIYLIARYSRQQNALKHNLLVEKMTRQHEQQLNQEKLKFFTNITHEFRTPLTLIQGPIEDLLRETKMAQGFKRKLMLIYRNTSRLGDLINKLLDFRKVETGLMKLKVSHGNLMQTVVEICLPFKEIYLEKKINFVLISEKESIPAWYDSDILQIILNNILSNAYKFTHEDGKVSVTVQEQLSPLGQNKVIVTITDTGMGIPEAHLPYIFERYYQTDQQNGSTGSGIGLALTQSLVELHKGKITVQSELGVGTTFRVELSTSKNVFHADEISETAQSRTKQRTAFPRPEPVPAPDKTQEKDEGNGTPKIMLVIEDNADIREYIRDSFVDEYKVLEAADGEEGLELAFAHLPDIIISDIMMPKTDGLEVCKRIKESLKTCHIPIMLLTARNSLYQKQEGYETGADSYVTKPFSTLLLKSRVRNLMESRKLLTEHISRTLLLQPDALQVNSKDEQFLSEAIAIIEENMADEKFSVELLASELGVSHPVLYRKITALTGFNIAKFIRGVRLKNAAQLLRTQQYTISEVAYRVGFNDIKYFRKCFKEQFKKLPSEYKGTHTDEALN